MDCRELAEGSPVQCCIEDPMEHCRRVPVLRLVAELKEQNWDEEWAGARGTECDRVNRLNEDKRRGPHLLYRRLFGVVCCGGVVGVLPGIVSCGIVLAFESYAVRRPEAIVRDGVLFQGAQMYRAWVRVGATACWYG